MKTHVRGSSCKLSTLSTCYPHTIRTRPLRSPGTVTIQHEPSSYSDGHDDVHVVVSPFLRIRLKYSGVRRIFQDNQGLLGFNPAEYIKHKVRIECHLVVFSCILDIHFLYVFADFSRGFREPDGRLFVADLLTGQIQELLIGSDSDNLKLYVKGIGQDRDGELYILASSALGPYGNTGVVLKLVPLAQEL